MLGTDMSLEDTASHLEKMRFGAEIKDGKITTSIPVYRGDILHPIDLVEDVAISYGYMKFQPVLPESMTFGKPMEIIEFCGKLRTTMVGFGYNEVITLTLSNEKEQFEKMGLEVSERAIAGNPLTEEHTCLKVSLIPSLLSTLRVNRHRDLPQKIFEVGIVVPEKENVYKLSGVAIHPKASFTEAKSIVEGILRAFNVQYSIESNSHGSFVDGRCASVVSDDRSIGILGELHPSVITNFDLSNPILAFELDVEGMRIK
jgi:phenylalanyl-tRNA synthetase beta chain